MQRYGKKDAPLVRSEEACGVALYGRKRFPMGGDDGGDERKIVKALYYDDADGRIEEGERRVFQMKDFY